MENTIKESFKFIMIIIIITTAILSKSAIIINNPWEKILAIVSTSFTALVTNLPTADLSK